MKTTLQTFILLAAVLGLATLARATAPSVTCLQAPAVAQGEPTTFRADVSDPDGDLAYAAFYVTGPGIAGWLHVGDVNVSGASASASLNWTPLGSGLFTVRVDVADTVSTTSAQNAFEVFAGRLIVGAVTIGSGTNRMYQHPGEIVTAENLTASHINVEAGGNLILWASGRVILKAGFHAKEGSQFWAAVDHDGNGYSDLEELDQHYIAGVPDAWLYDHGVNLLIPVSSWPFTPAQYLAAYKGGYDPADTKATATTSYPLVLRMPSGQYYGVQTSNWAIGSL